MKSETLTSQNGYGRIGTRRFWLDGEEGCAKCLVRLDPTGEVLCFWIRPTHGYSVKEEKKI